jgi:hypothetical protein
MIEGISESIRLNAILEKYGDKELNALYTSVFSSKNGQLVLQDLANRCSVYAPATEIDANWSEGARSVFLSIQTRLTNAIKDRKEG